jgi:hypothetical protein
VDQNANKIKWESSKDFDEVLVIIGRNRKLLMDEFKSLEELKGTLDVTDIKNVIGKVLSQNRKTISE